MSEFTCRYCGNENSTTICTEGACRKKAAAELEAVRAESEANQANAYRYTSALEVANSRGYAILADVFGRLDILQAESAGRLTALNAKAEEARRAWIRAEKAEGRVAALEKALINVMDWIENWEPEFTEDDEWEATALGVEAALAAGRREREG